MGCKRQQGIAPGGEVASRLSRVLSKCVRLRAVRPTGDWSARLVPSEGGLGALNWPGL